MILNRSGFWLTTALLSLAGCGGGGDSAGTPAPNPSPVTPPTISYTAGVFQPAASFAAQCQVPRTGNNPATGRAWPDIRGSLLAEKHFLRSWNNHLYLWYTEVPDRDPAATPAVEDYFNLLKTTATLPSGAAKDRFHFTYNTAEYQALAQSGAQVSYGILWALEQATPPRRLRVQFVEPGSVAATAGITRGAELITADGIDVVNDNTSSGVQTLNAAAFPSSSGATHQFVFRERGSTATRSVSMQAVTTVFNPTPVVRVLPTTLGNVGYLLFNDHIATAEQNLIAAINQLRTGNVQDLVLDLRYNGGGYLDIASELAYMIAGPQPTAGKTFERVQFNSKHPATNPVTGEALAPLRFHTTTQGFTVASGQALPTLNLPRVTVLTSEDTCSASEAIINGLKGAGVQVIQIGGDTCGKPYGFYPQDNCGTTYFSIQFKGVNELGFGDYFEGFSATRTTGEAQARLPGCSAIDDLSRDLGDPAEERLRVALTYRETGLCTGTSAAQLPRVALPGGIPLQVPAEPWRDNRILR